MKKILIVCSFLSLAVSAFGTLIYEDFNYTAGTALDSAVAPTSGLIGWDSNAAVGTGYTVAAGSLTYGDLTTSGNAAQGGNAYQRIGVDVKWATADWSTETGAWTEWCKTVLDQYGGSKKMVGKDSSTIWVSWLMNDTGIGSDPATLQFNTDTYNVYSSANPEIKVTLANGGGVTLSTRELTGGTFDKNAVVNTQTASAGTAPDDGVADLFVMKIEFGATSDTISLFVNPTLGSEPVTPSATITSAGDLFFKSVTWYAGNAGGQSQLDELRFGTTWAEVTPYLIPEPSTFVVALFGLAGLAFRRRHQEGI